jgi:smad nuclear-interacting protein 1
VGGIGFCIMREKRRSPPSSSPDERDRRKSTRSRSPRRSSPRKSSPRRRERDPTPPPNYSKTGTLDRERLTKEGVVLKYAEPLDATPPQRYQLHVFKNQRMEPCIRLDTQSCYLFGKEPVCDIVLQHPSISKQHAVIQYRRSKPYLIDLESSNGTRLNGKRIPTSRYVELQHKDLIQFAYSTREYVLLHVDQVE